MLSLQLLLRGYHASLSSLMMLGVRQCSVCDDARCSTILGVRRCSVFDDAWCATMLGVRRCSVCDDARCATILGVRCPVHNGGLSVLAL